MFYAENAGRGKALIHGETAEHLRRVLRVEIGQQYEISDRENLFLGRVCALPKAAVEFELTEDLPQRRQGAHITVLAALVKFDRFEWMLEKCSELGVHTVVPIVATRSEAGLEKAAEKRVSRWTRISEESGQQCRRVLPMNIGHCIGFGEALTVAGEERLLLDETGGTPLLACLGSAVDECAVCVGPEGGWTVEEKQAAMTAGWKSVSLCENILRAETAALVAVSQIQGRWWGLSNG